jgi:polyhydroxyalkanoate synthesis repressor PhaR
VLQYMLHCSNHTPVVINVNNKNSDPMNRPKIVIKKYENRRLYDTANSRYINLDEVAQLLKEGRDVEVVDAATGEDLTRLVLTQIIVEHAKEPDSAFPIDVLRQMVVASGKVTQEGAVNYMKAVFDMYQNAYRAVTPPLAPFDFMRAPQPSPANAPSGPEPRHPRGKEGEAADVSGLRQRIEELESLVSRFGAKKGPRKRKPGSRRRS